MKHIISAVTLCLGFGSVPVWASLDLTKKHACIACHAIDKKVLGPSYQDIAAKYKGQADGVAKLTASIRTGGSGKWGPVPMPPQAQLTDIEAKTLAEWISQGAK